uniref:Uncharacterized protein n=1 Tax=Chromera velia CCMP2878 TaxID=1169474 RepID=A0A0G4FGZ4_9ALVE|eukprot:Cvel_16977.t1-p1 / transcript=Cvel_16977.t1 / gene=Cvel_16977 / organism=Chromera_velia_CCMP2878 / gene_product=hypothetical protein / transcript_product=hypothetical protein / location=Cvel_scaffold1333:13949-15106(+) / protein_length=170 / sequence_SO=supercontig / SO=protein_coding / is_pseudo=false
MRLELNKIMSLCYRMDVEPLFALDIGNVIRSFQAVMAETLREALNKFMETGEKRKREDLELLLKVGAAVDAVVEVPEVAQAGGREEERGGQRILQETALMRAVDFGSLEAVKILVGAGAGLEVPREGGGNQGDGNTALDVAEAVQPSDSPLVAFLRSFAEEGEEEEEEDE